MRTLEGVPDDSFDAAFEAGTFATLETAEEVCAAAAITLTLTLTTNPAPNHDLNPNPDY